MHRIHTASLANVSPRELHASYHSEIDAIEEETWSQVLKQFDDASIYQTWSYDEVRCGSEKISHLVLKKSGSIVAVAQSRIVRAPLLNAGVAYVRWGPVWQRHGSCLDEETFRQAVRALRNEYTCKRGLVLRVYPILFREPELRLANLLVEEGFSPQPSQRRERTLLLDLSLPIDDLRKGLSSHWRRGLRAAQKNDLEIIEGSGETLFGVFIELYRDMLKRKRFVEPNNIDEFKEIQRRLPDGFKMRVLLCKSRGDWCSGLVCSAIGSTALYLYGATSDVGLDKKGSYLLHWTLIEALQRQGIRIYDLHGIDPLGNPGTYRFKKDLCGSNGKDVEFLGRFQTCTNPISYSCTALGEGVRAVYRRLRNKH